MPVTIALAGKGGVGKTTISSMVIKYLVESQPGAILAIDADPAANLNMVLGLDLDWTVGEIREDMLEKVKLSLTAGGAAMGTMPGGMTKQDYLKYEVHSALSEGNRFDLIAMGPGEGQGCYCAVNHSLREVIDDIGKAYRYVVIDNEAGMEHLSRRTTRDVDHLLVVTDPTQRGVATAQRIADMSKTLKINIENTYVIINRVMGGEVPPALQASIDKINVPFLGAVPSSQALMEFEYEGRPLVELENESPVYQAVSAMMEKILA